MKRNIIGLLAIFALLPFSRSFAQNDGIIYTDYEPDLCVRVISLNYPNDTIRIDFDQDGTTDFKVFINMLSTGEIGLFYISMWEYRWKLSDNDLVIQDGNWLSPHHVRQVLFYDQTNHLWLTHIDFTIGFRKEMDGHYYYAWVNAYGDIEYNAIQGVYHKVWAYVDDMAYCTIPDYPLRWGQTEISTGVDENCEGVFAVYPNPTKQSVTLIGQQIVEVRLYSVTGQLVATKQGKGAESLTVDISGLLSGLYFVTAIGKDGHKCVQKVVKQ